MFGCNQQNCGCPSFSSAQVGVRSVCMPLKRLVARVGSFCVVSLVLGAPSCHFRYGHRVGCHAVLAQTCKVPPPLQVESQQAPLFHRQPSIRKVAAPLQAVTNARRHHIPLRLSPSGARSLLFAKFWAELLRAPLRSVPGLPADVSGGTAHVHE